MLFQAACMSSVNRLILPCIYLNTVVVANQLLTITRMQWRIQDILVGMHFPFPLFPLSSRSFMDVVPVIRNSPLHQLTDNIDILLLLLFVGTYKRISVYSISFHRRLPSAVHMVTEDARQRVKYCGHYYVGC